MTRLGPGPRSRGSWPARAGERNDMYTLIDTTNNHTVSNHRSLRNARKAELAFLRRVERNNGRGAYVHTEIIDDHGRKVSLDESAAAYDYR